MRLQSVTETRDEYLALELAAAAHRLAHDVLEVRPGQTVVITVDTRSDLRVAQATASAVFTAGAIPITVSYHTQPRPQMDLPAPVAAAVGAADIWIEYAVAYTVYTPTWQRAVDAGVQYCGLNGLDADGMVRCIGGVDVRRLEAQGDRIQALLGGARMRVTSAAGTDILFTNDPGPVAAFRMRANPDHIPIMLAGQVSWTPIEASMTGRLVADGILSPPDEVGIISQPITLDVAQGRITHIEGGHEARLLRRWLDQRADPTMMRIAHVSMGFNPGIGAPTGRILEDERAMGDIDFGFGAWVGRPAAGHFDFTCRQVTITADNVTLQQDGAFVHPSLVTM